MKNYLILMTTVLFIASCGKGPETVVVKSNTSDLFNQPDSTELASDEPEDENFRQLRLGEIAPIESLDPLFATSNSEWRAMSLVYDGLTKLNEQGEPIPALAKRWTVNEDSTEFIFHLSTTTYFHDSPAFENGVGRKFTAKDVRYVFERMASGQVPEFASRHFMDLRGFSAYHNEQVYVKNPARRVLDTIEGLKIRNDSTLIFVMEQSAGDLLDRLAHPMASIYAHESVKSGAGPIQQAAGTGPYRFIKKEGDAHLFTSSSYSQDDRNRLNRLDIVSGLGERDLYQQFAQQNLDAIVEVSPTIMETIADSSGELYRSYYQDYDLQKSAYNSEYALYYNETSGKHDRVSQFFSDISWEGLMNTEAFGTPMVYELNDSSGEEMTQEGLIVTHSNHPIQNFLLDKLATKAVSSGSTFSMNASYALTDRVTFSNSPFPGTRLILKWNFPVYILTQGKVDGVRLNGNSWDLDLNNVQITGAS